MRTYTQLTQEQRYQISVLLKIGQNQTEIAEMIGKHKSTISREVRRNRGQRGYRPKQAHQMSLNRRNKAKTRIQEATWALIESKLQEDWSPEQISDWLKQNTDIQVSHERIYLYIYVDKRAGGSLHQHLRCQKKHRKRYGGYDRRGKLPNRRSIDERPEIVDQRQRIGDWEVDTMIGKGHRQAIISVASYLFLNAMVTLSVVVFLFVPGNELASLSVMLLDDAGETAQAMAMSLLIIVVGILARALFSLLTRGIQRRSQAWTQQ